MKKYKILLVMLALVFGVWESYAAANAGAGSASTLTEGVGAKPAYTLRPYADLPAAIQEAVDAGKLGGNKPTDPAWISSTLFFEGKMGFIRSSVEDYIAKCQAAGIPTRLIIGCGHADSPDGDGSCKGHGDGYYTVNISEGRHPDLLGDVFALSGYVFKPGMWDFIHFECFPWGKDFNEDNLKKVAKSLSPRGYFLELQRFEDMPRSITVGPRFEEVETDFKEGLLYKDKHIVPLSRTLLHNACDLAGISTDTPDERKFKSATQLQETVSNYFTSLGFSRGEMIMPPATVHYKWVEEIVSLLSSGFVMLRDNTTGEEVRGDKFSLAEIRGVPNPLTGEIISYRRDKLLTTGKPDLDALLGEEFLHRLHLGEEHGQGIIFFLGQGHSART